MIVCLMDKGEEEREKQESGRNRGVEEAGGTAHNAVKPNGENSVKHTRRCRLLSASGLAPAFALEAFHAPPLWGGDRG